MRTIKELLILLRENLPQDITRDNGGSICFTIIDMCRMDSIITRSEENLLLKYVSEKKPSDAGNFDGQLGSGFWWPYGELSPRLEFIDKLIAEL